ncbi:FAD-dependent oxidoreductase, partial [Aerococcus sp. UMB9870]
VIATGGRPKVPNVEGRELLSTSDDFFAWESLPESVVIVGAGYIGVEIAGVLNGLGVKVDVFEFQDQPLAGFDQM